MTKLKAAFRTYANAPCKSKIGMPIKLLQSAARKIVGRVVTVAVVVSALEPIQFIAVKQNLMPYIVLLQMYTRNFRFPFTTPLLAERARKEHVRARFNK
jgi:hypothetical protein